MKLIDYNSSLNYFIQFIEMVDQIVYTSSLSLQKLIKFSHQICLGQLSK